MADKNRMNRVDSEIQKSLAKIISRFDDIEIASSLISIMKVETFADFSMSKIYVSVFGDEAKRQHIVAKLNDNKKAIRYELAHSMKFRTVPDLMFIVDDVEEKAAKLNKLFKQIEDEGILDSNSDEKSDDGDANE